MAPPVLDNFGRVVEQEGADQWRAREGVALLLKHLAPLLGSDHVATLTNFYIPDGLHDRNNRVAMTMRSAAVQLVEHHGKVCRSVGLSYVIVDVIFLIG